MISIFVVYFSILSSVDKYSADTISTLEYISSVKKIKNKPIVNEVRIDGKKNEVPIVIYCDEDAGQKDDSREVIAHLKITVANNGAQLALLNSEVEKLKEQTGDRQVGRDMTNGKLFFM